MFEGISEESTSLLKALTPEPTFDEYRALLATKSQSVQDKLVAARQNVADLEAEEGRVAVATNELAAVRHAQG